MKKTCIVISQACLLTLAVNGQTIFNVDYESMTVGTSINSAFSYGTGTGSTFTGVVAEENGNKYLSATVDFAADAATWGAYAVDYFTNSLDPDITSAVLSTNPADWTISFDIRTQNATAGNIKLNFKALDANIDGATDASYGKNYSVTNGSWVTHSFTLDSMNPADATWDATNLSFTDRIQVFFEFQAQKFGGPGSTGNVLELDNFSVQVVPEPSTYALLLGLATLGFIAFRRIRRR